MNADMMTMHVPKRPHNEIYLNNPKFCCKIIPHHGCINKTVSPLKYCSIVGIKRTFYKSKIELFSRYYIEYKQQNLYNTLWYNPQGMDTLAK